MNRPLAIAAFAAAALAAAPSAAGQTTSVRGTWVGSAENGSVRVRYEITSLRIGRAAGTTQYRTGNIVCRGRLTLRARENRGYVFRDRVTSGSSNGCSTGDRIFARRSGSRLSVRLTVGTSNNVVRFTLRRS